jgi:hypothetical protein
MTLKTLSAIAIVTAFGSPAFAQDSAVDGRGYHKQVYTRHFRNTYNQAPLSDAGYFAARRASGDPENEFDRSRIGDHDFDRSRIGDHDADFNPSGS